MVGGFATNSEGDVSAPLGKIAFVRYSVRVGHPRIYAVALPHGKPLPLRLPGIATGGPAWSRDGQTLAFLVGKNNPDSHDITGSENLYVSRPDGSKLRRLTSRTIRVGEAGWAPDGRRLAFVRQAVNSNRSSLWTVALSNRALRQVTGGYLDIEPSWAPSGRAIAFLRIDPRTYQSGIWLVRPDGSGLRRILSDFTGASDPVWSPDGSRLLVQNGPALYSVRPDGAGREKIVSLTEDASGALEDPRPAWSPDGRWIVFCQLRAGSHGSSDIWIVRADGHGLRRLTASPDLDTDPSWGR
jgi:TolB protein